MPAHQSYLMVVRVVVCSVKRRKSPPAVWSHEMNCARRLRSRAPIPLSLSSAARSLAQAEREERNLGSCCASSERGQGAVTGWVFARLPLCADAPRSAAPQRFFRGSSSRRPRVRTCFLPTIRVDRGASPGSSSLPQGGGVPATPRPSAELAARRSSEVGVLDWGASRSLGLIAA